MKEMFYAAVVDIIQKKGMFNWWIQYIKDELYAAVFIILENIWFVKSAQQ